MDHHEKDSSEMDIDPQILTDPPPNHNPLIGLLQGDTLTNIYDCLSTLQDVAISPEYNMNPSSSTGFYFLMDCVKNALRFEIDYRDRLEWEREMGKEKLGKRRRRPS